MTTKVCIIFPADPLGTIPGGIDTFIRGILRWAPDDISLSLIGVTTDGNARPLGKWTECDLGRRKFNFYPLIALDNPGKRSVVPLSLRFSAALALTNATRNFDVLEFHRIEPSLIFYFSDKPKNVFIHLNMEVLRNKNSDIRWKSFPWLYYKLEDWLLPRMQSVFTVREDAVITYRKRFPEIANRFHFTPTWMDPDVFYPATEHDRVELRARLGKAYGFNSNDILLISVGRLDQQKNPILLLDAFDKVARVVPEARLIMVGDGVLWDTIAAHIVKLGLKGRVTLAGLRSAAEIADLLRVSNVFVLSSAYEGMPMCVLEALGTGLPVVTTDVGEVRRVVRNNVNGRVVQEHSAQALSEAIANVLENHESLYGMPCLQAVGDYTPQRVLAPIYDNYRRLAAGTRK